MSLALASVDYCSLLYWDLKQFQNSETQRPACHGFFEAQEDGGMVSRDIVVRVAIFGDTVL